MNLQKRMEDVRSRLHDLNVDVAELALWRVEIEEVAKESPSWGHAIEIAQSGLDAAQKMAIELRREFEFLTALDYMRTCKEGSNNEHSN